MQTLEKFRALSLVRHLIDHLKKDFHFGQECEEFITFVSFLNNGGDDTPECRIAYLDLMVEKLLARGGTGGRIFVHEANQVARQVSREFAERRKKKAGAAEDWTRFGDQMPPTDLLVWVSHNGQIYSRPQVGKWNYRMDYWAWNGAVGASPNDLWLPCVVPAPPSSGD